MKGSPCPNIVKVIEFGVVESPDGKEYFGFIIFEHCPNKDLFYYVEAGVTRHNEKLCCFIFTKLLQAIFVMHHCCCLVHRDIKLENVVLDGDFQPKIIDFGVTQSALISGNGNVGTIEYNSPEMFDTKAQYNPAPTDLFALGVLLFQMYFGFPPLEHFNREKLTQG